MLAHQLLLLLPHVGRQLILLTLLLLRVVVVRRRLLQRVYGCSILPTDLLRLHLLNYLLHVLTRVLQLGKLFLEANVEGLEGDDFLSRCHALDTCQQVMGDIVAHLENAVLLEVNLPHARVLDLVN